MARPSPPREHKSGTKGKSAEHKSAKDDQSAEAESAARGREQSSDRSVYFSRCQVFFNGRHDNLLQDEKMYEVKATVRIEKLHSSDMNRKCEGTVAMALNGQGSAISWRGRCQHNALTQPFFHNNPLELRPNSSDNLKDQTVFFGRPKNGRITAQVSVIESDDRTRAVLERMANWTAQASGLAGSALPGAPATVGMGLGLASQVFALSSKVVDNDLELLATTSFARAGTYRVVREDDGIVCEFEVAEVEPQQLGDGPVTVTLVSMESPDVENKEAEYPIKVHGKSHFVFSSTMGSGGVESEFTVSAPHNNGRVPVESVLGMHNAVLFSGKWPVGLPLPVSVSVGTTPKDDKLEDPITKLINSSAALTTAAVPSAAANVANISKAAQGVLSVVYNLRPLFMKDLRQAMGTISVAKEGAVQLRLGGRPNVVLNLHVAHGSNPPPPPPPYTVPRD